MKRFMDRVYLRDRGDKLYVYESSWDSFRPIQTLAWNPTRKKLEEWYGNLASDPLDPVYGYGSSGEEDHCIELTDKYIDGLSQAEEATTIEEFWKWSHLPMTWMFDRPLCLLPCVQPSFETWKTFPKKQRTLKKAPRTFDFRATKRRIR